MPPGATAWTITALRHRPVFSGLIVSPRFRPAQLPQKLTSEILGVWSQHSSALRFGAVMLRGARALPTKPVKCLGSMYAGICGMLSSMYCRSPSLVVCGTVQSPSLLPY